MLRVPSIKELTYKCKQCGFTNIKRKSISANPESWGVSRGITQTGSYSLATPTPDTFDYEVLSDGQPNHLLNPDMEVWSGGPAAAPDNWTLTGVGSPTIARESSMTHDGVYSTKLICSNNAGDYTNFYQQIEAPLGLSYWKGKTVTVGAWIWCAVSSYACVAVGDGVGSAFSYHTGTSSWQWLTANLTIDSAATYVLIACILYRDTTVHIAYFDQAVLVEGSSFQHNNISFTAATSSTPAKINDASNRFADLGFVPGDTIIISTTSGTNDGTYTLATRGGITNGSLSLSSADSLTTESANAAGTVTLSIRTYKPNITTGCSFCGSLNSR